MKLLNYFIAIFILFTSTVSCRKSFLDVENNTFILREQYVKDIKTLQQYLNGVYILLARDFYNGTNGHQIYTDLIADNIKPNTTNTTSLIAQYSWNQNTSTANSNRANMSGLWKNGYIIIQSCNFAIEKANELMKENAAKSNELMGEAYSLRALVHFVLVNTFAQSYNFTANAGHPGIPYITSWDWNDAFRRNTVKEVFDNMINDLNTAIPLLAPNNNNKIAMNRLAAKALLARIYLFKEDWQQAKTVALEVASVVPLLESAAYPSKLFTPEETEALFQLSPSTTTYINGSYTTGFQGLFFRGTPVFLATKDIVNLIQQHPNDSRNGWFSSSSIGKDSIRKYPINVLPGFGSGTNPNRSYFQTLLRSSEMYLTVAEASAKLNDETTAKVYLNAIRQRADPTTANSSATGAALLDSIYLERRKELAFEGFRMWDLMRWKQGVNRMDAATGAPLALSYPSDKAIAPIPIQDVNYGIAQNPSY